MNYAKKHDTMYVAALVLGVVGGTLSILTHTHGHIAVGMCQDGNRVTLDLVSHFIVFVFLYRGTHVVFSC